MVCKQCGNEIRDDAKFCPHCGAVNGPMGSGLPEGAAPYSPPAYTGPEAPVPGGGKKKGLIIGIAAAVIAVIAVLAVVMSGLFSSPKGKVEKAAAKSAAAYALAWKKLDLPDLNQLSLDQSVSQRLSLKLEELNTEILGYDLSPLEGLGLRFGSDLSGKDRRLGLELAAFWDSEDIISLQMAAEDNELYLASPELTDGEFYGVNTETLGDDLAAYGEEDLEAVSFNLFDLVDIASAGVEKQEEAKKALKEANRALWEAVIVKKQGAETLDINGTERKTASYRLTVPQEAMEDYADALVEVIEAADYMELYEDMLRASGMPEYYISDIMEELYGADPYGEMALILEDALEELGDVNLEVCLYDGYVAAVHWTDIINGSEIDVLLTLGGGGEYVDNLGLTVDVDGVKMTMASAGDHGCRSGKFTDTTTMRAGTTKLTSEFHYEPKGSGSNFGWKIGVPASASVDMEGRLSTTKTSMELNLETMAISIIGMDIVTLSMDYYAGPYDGQSAAVSSPKLVTEMDGLELMALGVKLQTNAQSWLTRTEELFTGRLPEELLQMIM